MTSCGSLEKMTFPGWTGIHLRFLGIILYSRLNGVITKGTNYQSILNIRELLCVSLRGAFFPPDWILHPLYLLFLCIEMAVLVSFGPYKLLKSLRHFRWQKMHLKAKRTVCNAGHILVYYRKPFWWNSIKRSQKYVWNLDINFGGKSI